MPDDKNYLPPELASKLITERSDYVVVGTSGSTDYLKDDAGSERFWKPKAALCQCTRCLRYLAKNRLDDASFINNHCSECTAGGLPLAKIREPGTLTPVQVELLGLITEECGEISQRVGLGDILAAMVLAMHNGLISRAGLLKRFGEKMEKFVEDANGPRQRITAATVPADGYLEIGIKETRPETDEELRTRILDAYGGWGAFCTAVLESSGTALDACAKHIGLKLERVPR